MDCSVKQQLLIAMNESLNALEEAVERMTNLAGKNKADEFVAAHRRVMELRPIADAARKELRKPSARARLLENPSHTQLAPPNVTSPR
jgi:hypothetical protein